MGPPRPGQFRESQRGSRGIYPDFIRRYFVNTILAFFSILLLRLLAPAEQSIAGTALYFMAQINVILAALNLIPIPPLDGSKILMGFLPEQMGQYLARLEPYGFFIIIGLFFFGFLHPLVDFFRWIILSIISVFLF